jgi:hypothetical protein
VSWVRPFALVAAILFFISWIFPIAAGLAKDTASFPKWWGTLDVGLGFVLAISALTIQTFVRTADKTAEDATYRIYRILTHGILAVAVLIMLLGDRIVWVNCATGFLWRTWLFSYMLPSWLTAFRSKDKSYFPFMYSRDVRRKIKWRPRPRCCVQHARGGIMAP